MAGSRNRAILICMYPLLFFPYYVKWHYGRGLKDLFRNISIGVSFVFSWFSVSELTQTLFAPWRRLGEEYQKGFHPEEFFSALLINTIMRIVGFVFRLIVIAAGLIATGLAIAASLVIAFVWIFYPFVLAFLLVLFFRLVL